MNIVIKHGLHLLLLCVGSRTFGELLHLNPMTQKKLKMWSTFKFWIIIPLSLGIIFLVYGFFWMMVSDLMMTKLITWAKNQRSHGYIIEWENIYKSGFPLQISFTLEYPKVEEIGSDGAKNFIWHANELSIEGVPWDVNSYQVHASGRHLIAFASPTNEYERYFTAIFDALRFAVIFKQGILLNINIIAQGIVVREEGKKILIANQISGEVNRYYTSDTNEISKTGDIEVSTFEVEFPELHRNLGRICNMKIDSSFLEVELFGPLPLTPNPKILMLWREAGGTVELRHVLLKYGQVSLDASGTIALDSDLQPVGSFISAITGYSELIDALNFCGILKDSDAMLGKLMLGVIAKKDSRTGEFVVSVPINLQSRTINIGPLTLGEVPEVKW